MSPAEQDTQGSYKGQTLFASWTIQVTPFMTIFTRFRIR